MALGPRLDLRQSQSLVMTPQLQQAIKLLALSNLEIETFIGEALESNPLLDVGEVTQLPPESVPVDERRTTLETSPVDALIGEGQAETDRPLDIDSGAIDDGTLAPGLGAHPFGGQGAIDKDHLAGGTIFILQIADATRVHIKSTYFNFIHGNVGAKNSCAMLMIDFKSGIIKEVRDSTLAINN